MEVLQIFNVLAYLLIIVCADDVTTASRDIYLFYVYGVTVTGAVPANQPISDGEATDRCKSLRRKMADCPSK